MKKGLGICAALMLCAGLVGCQPTPDKQAVVQKNAGAFESAVAASATEPFEAPAHYESEIMGAEGITIRFDADVELPDLERYPVYSVRPTAFTQKQVDDVLNVLLDGATLYENNTEQRSRDEIQRDIDYYTPELEACADDPAFADSAASYREMLKDLMIEYENAPETLNLKEAERTLQFNENDFELAIAYGERQPTEKEGEFQVVLTEEGKKRAQAAGNECVTGVFWKDVGGKPTKMRFYAANRVSPSMDRVDSTMLFEEYAGLPFRVTDLTQEKAEQIAAEALARMNIDAELVFAQRHAVYDWSENGDGTSDPIDLGTGYYMLTFKRRMPGTTQKHLAVAHEYGDYSQESFSPPLPAESITLTIDGNGISSFMWTDPMEVSVVENENMPLLPFEQAAERLEGQIKNVTAGIGRADTDSDAQRVVVDRLVLSYMMAQKPDSADEYYFIPVWDACGDVRFHYPEDYPDGTSNHYILDENRERGDQGQLDGPPVSLVTINAIDGSAIKRGQ